MGGNLWDGRDEEIKSLVGGEMVKLEGVGGGYEDKGEVELRDVGL